MNNLIKKILVEWSYRLDDGIIDLENYTHLSILREVLSDMEISSEVIIEVMSNITEKEKEWFYAIKKDTKTTSRFGSKETRDAAIKAGTHTAVDKKDDETEPSVNVFDEPTTDKDKHKNVKAFEDKIEKNIFLTDEQKKLAREANKKISVLYDDDATPEEKKEAAIWLIENMKLSTNAKTKTNNRKAYFNIFGGERKVISGSQGTKKSEDLIQRVEKAIGRPLDVVNVKGVKDKLSSAAKPDLGEENVVKYKEEPKKPQYSENYAIKDRAIQAIINLAGMADVEKISEDK